MNVCGLSRLQCRKCGEETLHKNGVVCVHCGTVYEVAIPVNKAPPWVTALQGANDRRAKAHKRAMSRLLIKP